MGGGIFYLIFGRRCGLNGRCGWVGWMDCLSMGGAFFLFGGGGCLLSRPGVGRPAVVG